MKIINLLIVLTFLQSCASTGENKITSNKALLIAKNDSFLKFLVPLSNDANSRFESVDGKKVSDFWNSANEINVVPGIHKVKLSCTIFRGSLFVQGEKSYEENFEAGNIYIFEPRLSSGNRCSFDLTKK